MEYYIFLSERSVTLYRFGGGKSIIVFIGSESNVFIDVLNNPLDKLSKPENSKKTSIKEFEQAYKLAQYIMNKAL